MLEELQISNLAIIDQQSVHFGAGLNVITGQTGAGKSILLQALSLILGAKPKAHTIRDGSQAAEVNALFSLDQFPLHEREHLPEQIRGDDQLVVSRTIPRSGSGRVYLNGKVSSLGMLRTVVEPLVDLCGQSEFVRLYEPVYQMRLLDYFGERTEKGYAELRASYGPLYHAWRNLLVRVERAQASTHEVAQRRDELQHIIADFEGVELGEGARAKLEEEIRRLSNAEQLIELTSFLSHSLENEEGILAQLALIGQEFRRLIVLDELARPFHERYLEVWRELSELHTDFDRYAQMIIVDEEALEGVRVRLARLAFLERKYRLAEGDLKKFYERSLQELSDLHQIDDAQGLRKELADAEANLQECSNRLTEARRKVGLKFSTLVAKELGDLNMKHASLQLALHSKGWGTQGADEGEFLFSSNKGYAPKQLRSIASGGELSRITLVMKKILSSQHGVSVMVFDEVDSGISGEVARSVGHKLQTLGRTSQILCITHLPQVASLADTHIYVEKKEGATTTSIVRTLEHVERVEELARMMAGYHVTEATRESARELLDAGGEK
jgi:DNA repair protein RecN (Recombination protein N)